MESGKLSEDYALQLDARDPLAPFKHRFHHIDGAIYMDGNSLGLMCREAEESLMRVVEEWRTLGIGGWTQAKVPWISFAEELGRLTEPLVGAEPGEVVATGGTTINLHALVATFYNPQGERRRILADELNFPSDLYALASQIALRGGDPREDLVLVRSRDGHTIEEDDVVEAMDQDVQLALLPSVYYRSGQLLDMERLTREAHERGITIGFDLGHSVGVVPHRLHQWGVDFAFWCNYKYVNGGPGSIGGLYVHQKHWGRRPGLAGWFGNDRSTMFDMRLEFQPAGDASAWQIGTTHILSAAPVEGSLRLINEAGIDRVREKSKAITSYLIELVDGLLPEEEYGFHVVTPRDPERRGGHVGVSHPDGWRVNQALIARGVVPDFRPPNIIRLAPVPLYTSYHDVWRTVHHMKAIIDRGEHLAFGKEKPTVT